jgi:hypothetical protein
MNELNQSIASKLMTCITDLIKKIKMINISLILIYDEMLINTSNFNSKFKHLEQIIFLLIKLTKFAANKIFSFISFQFLLLLDSSQNYDSLFK